MRRNVFQGMNCSAIRPAHPAQPGDTMVVRELRPLKLRALTVKEDLFVQLYHDSCLLCFLHLQISTCALIRMLHFL